MELVSYKNHIMQPINFVMAFIQLIFIMGILRGPYLWVNISCFSLMVITITLYFSIYIYLLRNYPNKLQSERVLK